jgi:hypothetical protein
MSVIIRIAAQTTPSQPAEIVGRWVKSFDVEAFDGRGDVVFTGNPREAMRFADLEAAVSAWKTQSRTRPLRPDGRPNRPLTALSITFDPAK